MGEFGHALRLLLVALGAILVSRGWLNAVEWEAILGALLGAGGAGWSWFERQRLKKEAGAAVGTIASLLLRLRG